MRARILGLGTWLMGRSAGEVCAEDYVAESLVIVKNSLVRFLPALTWRIACPGPLASRGQQWLLHLALRLCDIVSRGKRTVWKRAVQFEPEILMRDQVKGGSPGREGGGN